MKTLKTNWTNNEFKAYILLYAANADYIVTDTEKDIILELVDQKQYHTIYAELNYDNDYTSIQKIQYNIEKFNYSENDIKKLLSEIKELFLSDGKFDYLEKYMLKSLERIFKA